MQSGVNYFSQTEREGIARSIITKFGGITALANALGHRHITTVAHWWKVGIIPTKWQQDLFILAPYVGVSLAPDDFFTPPGKES